MVAHYRSHTVTAKIQQLSRTTNFWYFLKSTIASNRQTFFPEDN